MAVVGDGVVTSTAGIIAQDNRNKNTLVNRLETTSSEGPEKLTARIDYKWHVVSVECLDRSKQHSLNYFFYRFL